jgi:hypothetical protein
MQPPGHRISEVKHEPNWPNPSRLFMSGSVIASAAVWLKARRTSENHSASATLQDAGHGGFGICANQRLSLLANDHRAVVKVAHTLPR